MYTTSSTLDIIYMTKHPECSTPASDRPALEITEEMIEAGVDVLRVECGDVYEVSTQEQCEDLCRHIFAAMSYKRKRRT